MKPKKDKYLKARGGKYKIYDIYCSECGALLFRYRKDGPGVLKRCYWDRVIGEAWLYPAELDELMLYECTTCGVNIGKMMYYKPENRPAVRLFVGAVVKRGVRV